MPVLPDVEDFKDYVASFGIFADPGECRAYVDDHYRRFARTLAEVPERSGRLLEIGAAPFCMTLLLRAARAYQIHLVNYGSEGSIRLASEKYGEEHVFPCCGPNVECEPLPHADASFDVVLCAEVIEHLTFCPSQMLAEIHRVLAPHGTLILTTPNALRQVYDFECARNRAHGLHLEDPYSGYGPYGRHNREFTPDELRRLVEECGFGVRTLEVVDLAPRRRGADDARWAQVLEQLFGVDASTQDALRGGQILLRAGPDGTRRLGLPDDLYKSTHALRRAQACFPRIP